MTAFDAGALTIAAAAAVTDVRSARIPNLLTVAGVLLGLAAHATWAQGAGLAASALGAAAGLAVFFPFFALGGMGGGDVKLMAALGAWVGWRDVVSTALYAAVAGGVLAVAISLAKGYLATAMGNLGRLARWWRTVGLRPEPSLTLAHGRGPRVPYAVPILAGLMMALWLA